MCGGVCRWHREVRRGADLKCRIDDGRKLLGLSGLPVVPAEKLRCCDWLCTLLPPKQLRRTAMFKALARQHHTCPSLAAAKTEMATCGRMHVVAVGDMALQTNIKVYYALVSSYRRSERGRYHKRMHDQKSDLYLAVNQQGWCR